MCVSGCECEDPPRSRPQSATCAGPGHHDRELITRRRGLQAGPCVGPPSAAEPACCSSPLPDPLTSAGANEQPGRLSRGPSSSWALLQVPRGDIRPQVPKEREGGRPELMFCSTKKKKNHRRRRVNTPNHRSECENMPRTAALIIH